MNLATYFWSQVQIKHHGACWPFWGYTNHQGESYVLITEFDRYGPVNVRRVAFYLVHGRRPRRVYTLNTCVYKNCCNPLHLWDAEQAPNLVNIPQINPQVDAEMLSLYNQGYTISELAETYRITRASAHRALDRARGRK